MQVQGGVDLQTALSMPNQDSVPSTTLICVHTHPVALMQVQGGVDLQTALSMLNQDTAFAVQQDQEGGRLRQVGLAKSVMLRHVPHTFQREARQSVLQVQDLGLVWENTSCSCRIG